MLIFLKMFNCYNVHVSIYVFVEVCDTMTYGSDCASSCGNCSNGETCHYVDGSCPHGCEEGATGNKCQNSMSISSGYAFRF